MANIIIYKIHRNDVNVLPEFNEGFSYTYTDINENSTVTRTITSDMTPTSISFKNNNVLKITTLDLTSVEELDLDNLDLSAVNGITSIISNCSSLKVLRAKAKVINDIIPYLQTKSNSNSGTIKVSDVMSVVDNEALNAKHWYIDAYRYVDLFIMMGQSNMEGQSEKPEAFEVPAYQSYTYMYNTNELAQVKHPYGEWINNQVTDEALKQSWLADPSMSGVWWQMEGAEGGQMGEAYASLQPYFAAEYYKQAKVPTLMVQCACGATTVGEWLPGHEKGRYELAVEKISRAVAKAEAEIDRPIRNRYLVWLQGESDGIYKTGTENYKTRFLQLWNALKTDCGLEKCFMIRVAQFRPDKYNDKPIIEAQEQLAQENDDIIMATRITGLLEYPTENPENPTIQDGVTEGYPYVDHYTVAGYKLVGETTAAKIAEYLKIGLRPELEPEPYEGEITSSNERLIVSYKYSGTTSLIPTFDTTFDYRIIDTPDGSYTHRKIISEYVPTRISFQAKSALREVTYIDTSKLTTGYGMFYNCTNLTYINMPYVTYVTTMEGMFNGCKKLQRIEGIEKWNTARNSNWGSTFGNCNALTNLDPRNFILTDAHAMGATFRGCYSSPIENFDFSNWCTPNIQYLSGTFDGLKSVIELDVSTFNVSSVGNLQGVFQGCTNLQRVNISNWILTEKHYNWQGDSDKWNPLNVGGMFNSCPALVEVKMENSDRFSIHKVAGVLPTRTADKPSTFIISMDTELDNELASLIESKGWNVSYKKKDHEYVVVKYYFDPKIGNILPVFNNGFEYTYTDEIGLYDQVLRTIKATSLPTNMYFGTNHVSQDDADSLINVLEIDTSNIEDLSYMFKGCRNIGLIPIGLVTSKATRLTSMFEGCSSLDLNYLYQWYTENVVDMSYMFKDCIGMTSIGIEELKISEETNIEGMFEGCISLRTVRAIPAIFDKVASVLPDRPFDEPGQLTIREGTDNSGSIEDITCDDELLKHNWLTDRNRHLDLFVMMGQSNMQGQSEIYKEFEVPMYQSCTYLYNKDELAQVKHPFGENIQTLGTIEELGYWQLEGAVGCDTGLPYGSLSPHFAASYYEQTHTPTLMVQCARGATTMKDWLPGTTQQRFEIAVEKTQKSIAAVEEIGRTIRGKYLVWLQGESDGSGTGVGTKKATYKTRFLQFWNAIKAELGFEKCFIIRVHKFRDGYKYNCYPIIEAQEELALENDDIEMVTRVTGYLQYYDENPEHYTIQHAYQGLQIVSNHDHYTWEGYKLVGDTAGSRVGQYVNTGIMPALEPEPWADKVTASSKYHVTTYKFDNTVYANYVPEFNEGYEYSVIDKVEGNVTTRKIIGVGLPTLIRFGAYYTYDEIEELQRTATEREKCLLEVTYADTSTVTDATNMFCLNENLTSVPALVIQNCTSLYCMFYKCNKLTQLDCRNYDMSKVTNVENFAWQCLALTSIDTTGWDISNVNNMYTMFINAQKLTEIKGIEDWNVSNVKTMISSFYACKAITSLDLSRWNVKNVTTIWWLFNGCLTLQTLDISNWNLANCVDYTEPFKNCKVLDTIVMNNSDYKSVNKIIQGLPAKTASAPGILKINGVDDYNQVDIDVATSKYWTVEYVYDTASFDTKLVSLKNLNAYSQKMNNHYKNLVDERISNINESVNEQFAGLQSSIQALENNKANLLYVDEKLGVVDGKIEDINESVNEQVAGLQSSIQALENNKADISYVNGKLEVVDAIKLNGYSLWVGTTAELEAIENRDPNTLYFEIGDDTTTGEEVVQVDVVNGVLQLTADKYQKTNMLDGTEIVFPSVNKFTEIHLYFAADSNMNISLPDNCKWRVEPNIEEGNYYEIVAVYNTMFWLVNVISYSDEYNDDTDSNKLIWYDNNKIYSNSGSMETSDKCITSDFISLEENKDYQITVLNNTDTEIHCYDDEKNYLSDLDVSLTNYGVRVYSLRKMFEMDDMDISNTKYIRIETKKNEYINATSVNEKIIIEEIDTLEDNQVPLIIMDDCSINTNGDRKSESDYISIQHIVLDNYFNYQFEFLGSDSTVNYYDEGEVLISRDKGENNDYFEGRQVVLNSDDFPEGTKSVRIRFMKNDTITFENIHEYLKVTKTPVVSENIIPLNWIDKTGLSSTTGKPSLKDTSTITDFIEIDDSYYYTITLDEPNDVKEYYYNSNKEFISRASYDDISTGNEVLEFPEGTKYIRLKSDIDNEYTIDVVKERIILRKFLKEENFLYSFGLLSDVHIDNNYDADYSDESMSIKDYKNALRFLEDEGANFIAYCGDMTKNHSDAQADYQMLAECLKKSHVPNYIIKGNHDAGQGYFDEYVSEISRFTVPYKDDLFIFVGNGSDTGTNAGMTQSRIDYIRGIIEDNPDRRLFLMYHQFIRGYGSGDGTGELYSGSTIGDNPNNALTNEFIELVTSTPNLIYCHGHSHIRFNVQDTCPTANYYHADGECHDIHVPSCARPRIPNESGGLDSYFEGSEGYIVDVYSDKVIFKAIDFATNRYMPEYNQVVNLAAVAAEYDSIPNPTLYIDTENGSIAADGTIQDISGNNYPITAYNTNILDDGVIAFNIDNKSYLECGLDPNDTCWTAEIYFRLTDIIEQDMKILGWGTSENKFATQYDWDKYSLDFKYGVDIEKDNFDDYIDYDTNTDFTNKFVHIMYSCDGDSVVININGKTVITCDVTPMTEVAKNIIIGKHYNSDKEYANMELKLFRFYNGVALNRYQMQCNYLNLIRG